MKKIVAIYQQKKSILLPSLGVLCVSFIAFVYFLLGKASYVQVHDQVDGEILNYIYQAKYLFQGNVIPEFMNGMAKEAMTPPAPFGVLFYKVFEPFVAYVVMQWFVVVVGFLGMYGLCNYLKMPREIGFVVGVMFSYMPFYPTYGLAGLGAPLLVWCFLCYLNGEGGIWPLLGIILYAGMSSLVLVGYVWLAFGGAVTLCLLIKEVTRKKGIRGLIATMVLLVTYVLVNLDLFKTLLGIGYVTHREEKIVSYPIAWLGRFKELLLYGGSYSNTYASGIILVSVMVILFVGRCTNDEIRCRVAKIRVLLGGICVAAALAATWNTALLLTIRHALGGMFEYFEADRIYWTFPFWWMLLLAFVLDFLWVYMKFYGRKLRAILGFCVGMFLLLLQGAQIFRDGTMNKNIRLLLMDGYTQKLTWESVYMEDVFAQIEAALLEDKSTYSVVSLGMYPSIALYNGYICADGYSNNYDLEYKHAFRRIIANELEKSEEVKAYFDDWGNRLYLPSAQTGYDVTIQKGKGVTYESLAYDVAAMKELNVRYVFAAAPISNASELGMELVAGSPFASDTSYYEVFVYKVL